MSYLIERLTAEGCDIKRALECFLNDESIYEEFYKQLIDDEAFGRLGDSIKSGDVSEAYNNAHSLKGTIGNMGITPMYKLICKMSDQLKANSFEGISDDYEQLLMLHEHYKSLL